MYIKQILTVSLMALVACSSTPQITELPLTANPVQEIARVDEAIKAAAANQVNALSPTNFELATGTLDKAKEARNKNKDQKEVLHKIALAQSYLDKANAVAGVANQVIPGVVKERQNALTAMAPKYFSQEFSNADSDLNSFAKDMESGDTSSAEKIRGNLQARYSDLELQSIRKLRVGDARNNIEQAIKEGAKQLVPQTLTWAVKKVDEDDAAVTTNRHDAVILGKASADATAASTRLLNMARQAKSTSQQTPEQMASQIESNQIALSTSEANLGKTTADIATKKSANAALTSDNRKLEEKDQLEQQFEFARQQFTAEEAEVYKQGDKLLLRLKGLSFPKDQAVITTDNYALLTKVQKVIKDTGPEAIIIEGHTDSTGSEEQNKKLSVGRAEAVEGYLKANNALETAHFTASGFGDTKPIASNKTKVGRAQNRRVDVILNSHSIN